MSIADLADDLLGRTGGANLSRTGRYSQAIARTIDDESASTSLIATIFWQAFMNSPAFFQNLRRTEISSRGVLEGEKIILRHGVERAPRHDLIIFDSGFRDDKPSLLTKVNASVEELRQGWDKFISTNLTNFIRIEPSILINGRGAALEASKAQEFGLIVMAPLQKTLTSLLPTPALGVAHKIEPSISTLGIIGYSQGKEGATTALHSLDAKQQIVYIGGNLQGIIDPQDRSVTTDSCFIQVPGIVAHYKSLSTRVRGPLRGITPNTTDILSFERENVGRVNTRAFGWHPDIPLAVTPRKKLLILTDPITIPSDSGTALLDGKNRIVGFAYSTNGASAGYSDWVWAESVFEAHMLK